MCAVFRDRSKLRKISLNVFAGFLVSVVEQIAFVYDLCSRSTEFANFFKTCEMSSAFLSSFQVKVSWALTPSSPIMLSHVDTRTMPSCL